MEEQLATLLHQSIHPPDPAQLGEVTQIIDSLRNRPDVIQGYIAIVSSAAYEESVRLNACIQLRVDIEHFWGEYDNELRSMLLQTIPEVLITVPGFLRRSVSHLAKRMIYIIHDRAPDQMAGLPDAIMAALQDPGKFLAGVVLCRAFVRCLYSMYSPSERHAPADAMGFALEVVPVLSAGFDQSDDLFLMSQCLALARVLVIFHNSADFLTDFGPWLRCLDVLSSGRPLDGALLRFAVRVLRFFTELNRRNRERPIEGSPHLLEVGFQLLAGTWTVDPVGLQVAVFRFLSNENQPFWEEIAPHLPDVFSTCVLPLFEITAESVGASETDPIQFVADCRMTIHSSDLGEIARKRADIAGWFFELARTAIEHFARDGNVGKLYGRLLLASAGWGSVYQFEPDMVHEFYEAAAPVLLESTETLAQVGFLQILGEEARMSREECSLCLYGGREPAPEHLAYAMPMLESPNSLVRYFATTTVWKLIAGIARPDKWDVVRDHVDGKILLIVESVLELAREYGVSSLMRVVSRLVKDPFLLEQIVGYAPSFTATAFDLAGEFCRVEDGLPPVLNSVLNLVVCLKDHPDEEDRICRHIFEQCMESIDFICENPRALDSFIEVFNVVVLYTPEFYPELWRFVDVFAPMPMEDLSIETRLNVAYLFHNLMMRDPERVATSLPLFLEFGSQFLTVEDGLDILSIISVYNSALFACAPPGSIAAEYIALLCQALEPHVGEWHEVTFQDCLSDISAPDQFMLSLLQYSPAIVVEHLPELFAQWFELADDADCACALALAFPLMAPDFRQQQLAHVLGAHGPRDLISEEDDFDTQKFESEGHVQARAIRVFTREKAVQLFIDFLNELVTQDPQLAAALDVLSFLQATTSEDE